MSPPRPLLGDPSWDPLSLRTPLFTGIVGGADGTRTTSNTPKSRSLAEDREVQRSSDAPIDAAKSPIAASLDTASCLTADAPGDVDRALADALTEAANAGRFDVVATLAAELQARRLASAGAVANVIPLRRGRRSR